MPGVSESPTLSTTTPMSTSTPITQSSTTSRLATVTVASIGNTRNRNDEQTDQQQQTSQVIQDLQQFLSKQRENIELQNKCFESVKILMNHIQKTSDNFLAVERLRIQSVRGNLLNPTTFMDDVSLPTGTGVNTQSSPQDINIEVTKALNNSITTLKTTLESNYKKN